MYIVYYCTAEMKEFLLCAKMHLHFNIIFRKNSDNVFVPIGAGSIAQLLECSSI